MTFPSWLASHEFVFKAKSDGDAARSARELEILALVAKGLTNKEISGVLKLSHHTVELADSSSPYSSSGKVTPVSRGTR